MRSVFIRLGLIILRWCGYDLAHELTTLVNDLNRLKLVIHAAEEEIDELRRKEAAKKGRSAMLKGVINGLLPDVGRIVGAGKSQEWQRHQLYAIAIKRYPTLSKTLVSLSVEYALYYQEHKSLDPETMT